jgi:L-Ala-D/L-Glu epimerase
MIITQIGIYKVSIPLKEPFITSLGKEVSADNIVIVIHTDNGMKGFGECNPFMPINGESIDTCYAVAQYFAKALKGENPLEIKKCINLMDRVIYGNSSIKSAFDIALYDIASQHAGKPLYQFLGGTTNKELITDYTVSIGEIEKMAADALKIKEAGYPAIKVKLGQSAEKDIARIKAIRAAVGPDIPLRLDANQGWKVKSAIEILNALKDDNVQYCEEPIARWNFMKLKKVKKNSPIPIMADECCCTENDVKRLIKLQACDKLNIKMGKSGGLFIAKKMLKLAEKENMEVQIGAFMESRLAMTAFAHLALSSSAVKYCDFDTPLMHAEDYVEGGLTYHENGVMKLPDTIGLGAKINDAFLNECEHVIC